MDWNRGNHSMGDKHVYLLGGDNGKWQMLAGNEKYLFCEDISEQLAYTSLKAEDSLVGWGP